MSIFRTINKDSSLNRTFKFTDMKHTYFFDKLATTYKVYEFINGEWCFVMNHGIEGRHYKHINSCAKYWLRMMTTYDGIRQIESESC